MSNADDRCAREGCGERRMWHLGEQYERDGGVVVVRHPFVEPAPQPAPPRLSTPVPLPWDMPTLSREDARIAREQINPAPRWPSQPEPDKVIASCEAGIDECSFECQQYGQRHTPENAGTACPTDQTVDVPQPEPHAFVDVGFVGCAHPHPGGGQCVMSDTNPIHTQPGDEAKPHFQKHTGNAKAPYHSFEHLQEALSWIERNHPGGIRLVARALSETGK